MNATVPITLKYRWTNAARRAFLLVPTEENSAVVQEPMFWPMIMGRTAPYGTVPVTESACRIPMDAEELCNAVVMRIPTSIPMNGLVNVVIRFTNSGTSFRGSRAVDMVSMPIIRKPKPARTLPIS